MMICFHEFPTVAAQTWGTWGAQIDDVSREFWFESSDPRHRVNDTARFQAYSTLLDLHHIFWHVF